jgi:hypothetical protein
MDTPDPDTQDPRLTSIDPETLASVTGGTPDEKGPVVVKGGYVNGVFINSTGQVGLPRP